MHLPNFEVIAIEFYQKCLLNVTLIGDFNLSSDDVPFENFMQAYNLTSLIKEVRKFSI